MSALAVRDRKRWYRGTRAAEAWIRSNEHFRSDRYRQEIFRLLALRPGERVLDCPVGTGEPHGVRAAQAGARVFGLDISRPLLETCAESGRRWDVNIALTEGDLESLPFRDDVFDKVYCFGAIWNLPDYKQGVREIVRVARPGATIVFDTLNALHVTPLVSYLATRLSPLLKKTPGGGRPTFPPRMSRLLKELGCAFQMKGFFLLLPTALPVLGARANLVKYSDYLSFACQDSAWRYLGNTLVYVCRKDGGCSVGEIAGHAAAGKAEGSTAPR